MSTRFTVQVYELPGFQFVSSLEIIAADKQGAALGAALQLGLTSWDWLGFAFQPWHTAPKRVDIKHVVYVEERS